MRRLCTDQLKFCVPKVIWEFSFGFVCWYLTRDLAGPLFWITFVSLLVYIRILAIDIAIVLGSGLWLSPFPFPVFKGIDRAATTKSSNGSACTFQPSSAADLRTCRPASHWSPATRYTSTWCTWTAPFSKGLWTAAVSQTKSYKSFPFWPAYTSEAARGTAASTPLCPTSIFPFYLQCRRLWLSLFLLHFCSCISLWSRTCHWKCSLWKSGMQVLRIMIIQYRQCSLVCQCLSHARILKI